MLRKILTGMILFCSALNLQANEGDTRYLAGLLSFHQEGYAEISTYAFGGVLGITRPFSRRTWAGWRAETGYRQHSSLQATEGNWISSLHGSIGLEATVPIPRFQHILRPHLAAGNLLHHIAQPVDTEDDRLKDEWYLDRFLELGLELSLRIDDDPGSSSVFIAPRLWIFAQGGFAIPVLVGLRR
ncbi:hypothetical protein SAMN05920897_11579 [Alkalispirochaeta americana]|uniref:Outer membrane protein beta-barrel domain-containing protein n=1 Tax=Alkalispirochaeta americana TaxID=159291 RepID=A0A1N6VTX7_9SPIO|nr:hypothetical protein [Alkalispirochaeta americana]SIQ81126.1 hypothetical protein SAMN05920897_11579 [Alkalispirochaeta americana]